MLRITSEPSIYTVSVSSEHTADHYKSETEQPYEHELLPVFRTGLILNGLGLCKGLVPILHRGQALELFL